MPTIVPLTLILSQDESRFCSESNRITSWSEKGKKVVYSGYRYGTSLNCFGSIDLNSFNERGNADATIAHFQKARDSYTHDIPSVLSRGFIKPKPLLYFYL